MENNKFSFQSISRTAYKLMSGKEKKTADKYIKFGNDNNYPSYLIDLYNNSSIHASCVNSIVDAIRGEGLVVENEAILDKANKAGESWNDIFNKIALDYKLFGGYALEIIYSRDRERIADVYHVDFSNVRAGEKDDMHKVPGYFISDEWEKHRSFNSANTDELPYLPCYNPEKRNEEPKQLLYFNKYRPGQQYYPLPDYVAASRVIDLDQEVDNFHINNIKNGLAPSMAITTFTNANDEERSAIENMLRVQYQGSGNAGNLVYMDVADPALAPRIEPIPQNGADGYYTTVDEMTTQKVLTAHRITSPALLGIKTNTGLGNNADEIETAWRLFLNTVVLSFQQDLLVTIEDLLSFNFGDVTVGVLQKNPLYEGDSDEMEVVTSQEADVEEVNDLEDTVEETQIIE